MHKELSVWHIENSTKNKMQIMVSRVLFYADVHAQTTAVLLFKTRKLTYKTTRINTTSTTQPALSFHLREI